MQATALRSSVDPDPRAWSNVLTRAMSAASRWNAPGRSDAARKPEPDDRATDRRRKEPRRRSFGSDPVADHGRADARGRVAQPIDRRRLRCDQALELRGRVMRSLGIRPVQLPRGGEIE